MNIHRFFVWAIGFCSLATGSAYALTTAIVGGTIITGTGATPIKQGVLVFTNDRIVAVGDRHTEIPADADIIHAKGKTLIPGLMNANTHLVNTLPQVLFTHEEEYEALIIEAAQVALKNGVTTVFDSWGPRQALVNARNAINKGSKEGSRIFLAGNIVGYDGPLSADFEQPINELGRFFNGSTLARINDQWVQGVGRDLTALPADAVRPIIRDYTQQDIDFVKYAVNGHSSKDLTMLTFSPRVNEVIVDEAHRAGLIVQTHTSTLEGLRLAIDTRVDLLQHCETTELQPLTQDLIDAMVTKRIPCGALVRSNANLTWADKNMPSGFVKQYWFQRDKNIRAMIEAGVTLLLATDGTLISDRYFPAKFAGLTYLAEDEHLIELDQGHFTWLKAVSERGMKPMDALQAATLNIAKAYKQDKDLGSLEPGKKADIVILNKNPLKDPKHYQAIHGIIKDGRWIDRAQLPTQPILTRQD